MLPGRATLRNLSRYSSSHERTFSRWYARDFDVVSLNKAAMSQVLPPDQAQALVIDASFVPKSGKKTYGLDRFWNGSPGHSEKGLEISTLAWLAITDHCAYCLRACLRRYHASQAPDHEVDHGHLDHGFAGLG
jgi:hypothetical protein